jgi:hypothetical protein
MPRPRKATGLPKKRAGVLPPVPTPKLPAATVIATRAYELFLQRGGVHGYDREDWLTAERELVAGAGAEA